MIPARYLLELSDQSVITSVQGNLSKETLMCFNVNKNMLPRKYSTCSPK
jgi:hypothetical protein